MLHTSDDYPSLSGCLDSLRGRATGSENHGEPVQEQGEGSAAH